MCNNQPMVNFLDIIIGNITTKLKNNGQWDNTLIVFSADNGGEVNLDETSANNYPLRYCLYLLSNSSFILFTKF